MKLLDLFCGAGGAAMGYHLAGFNEIVGVDINPQPHYPFEFVQADATTFPLDGYDAIHASPPCQAYSVTRHSHNNEHAALIEPVREMLEMTGTPYVIENVVGAPLIDPVVLCGASFNLKAFDETSGKELWLKRHRLFESNVPLTTLVCACKGKTIGGVYGHGPNDRKSSTRGGYTPLTEVRRQLMGISWMNRNELSQAIPPAYTIFLGEQVLQHIKSKEIVNAK